MKQIGPPTSRKQLSQERADMAFSSARAAVQLLSKRTLSSTALGAAMGGATLSGVALCNEDHISPMLIGFDHEGPLQAFDAKSVRRGFQVCV